MIDLIIENIEEEHAIIRTFHETLLSVQDRIELCLLNSFPKIDIDNELLSVKQKIEKCRESSRNPKEGSRNPFKENSERLAIKTIETAVEHTQSAENEYINKNTETAWSLLCGAILLIGDLQSEAPFEKEQYFFERASSGGNARRAKLQPAKEKAIELLHTKNRRMAGAAQLKHLMK